MEEWQRMRLCADCSVLYNQKVRPPIHGADGWFWWVKCRAGHPYTKMKLVQTCTGGMGASPVPAHVSANHRGEADSRVTHPGTSHPSVVEALTQVLPQAYAVSIPTEYMHTGRTTGSMPACHPNGTEQEICTKGTGSRQWWFRPCACIK